MNSILVFSAFYVLFCLGKDCELKLCRNFTNCLEPHTENLEMFKGVALYGNTEPPNSGVYTNDFNASGIFTCSCCGQQLFSSTDKLHNHESGYPTFSQPISNTSTYLYSEPIYGRVCDPIIQVACKLCGIHLGQMGVNNETYEINSVCLNFIPDKKTVTKNWLKWWTQMGTSLAIAISILFTIFLAFSIKNAIFPKITVMMGSRYSDNEWGLRGGIINGQRLAESLDDAQSTSEEHNNIFNIDEEGEQELKKRTSFDKRKEQ